MSDGRNIDRRVWKLFDGYVHGTISRREFLDGAARFTATGVSAATLLATLSPDYALARQVDPDDRSISTSYKKYASPHGARVMRGYFARPGEATGGCRLHCIRSRRADAAGRLSGQRRGRQGTAKAT
jgi:carboxymethylenebutenolidase